MKTEAQSKQQNENLCQERRDQAINDINAFLVKLTARMAEEAKQTDFNWGDVGDLNHVRELLQQIDDFWFSQDE